MKIGSKDSCVINFESKGFDNMHISSVFRSQNVVLKLLEPLQTDGNNPVLAMKLARTIQNKILNYRDNVNAISVLTVDF